MKLHISNVYGMIQNKRIVKAQKRIAEVGRRLGCYELGIYDYPGEQEKIECLEKRIEGILSAVEDGDIVVFQLPSGNGKKFDEQLIKKIREKDSVKLILLWHSYKYFLEQEYQLSIWADCEYNTHSVSETMDNTDDYMIEKMLTDAVMKVLSIDEKRQETIHIGFVLRDIKSKILQIPFYTTN